MPTVLTDGPYRIAFWSQDCAEPAHMHVFRDNKSANFWLETGAIEVNHGFRRKELREISRLIAEHQSLLQEKWNEHCRRA